MQCIRALLVTALISGCAFASSITLLPSGTVSGSSGGTVGWGYNVSNSTTDWMILNDSFVTGSLASGTYGTYVDYIVSNFIVINPGSSTGPVNWNAGSASGTGEFDLAAVVPPNTAIPGGITVDYSLFSQDPNDPSFDPGSFVSSGTVGATAQVNANFTSTPEPATASMMGMMLIAIAWLGWKRRLTPKKAPHRV